MERSSYRDWQPGHLNLSAPSLYVVMQGPSAAPKEVFKLALRELIGLGVLRPVTIQQGHGRSTTRTVVLVAGPQPQPDLERPLRSIMDAWAGASRTTAEGSEGVTLQDLAAALRARYKGKLGTWVQDEVLAVLVERKLYTREDYKRLFFIPAVRFDPTPEGKAAQVLLQESVERTNNQFSDWAANDPVRAATFLTLAGSGVLLLPELQPAVARFRRSQEGDSAAMSGTFDSGAENDDRDDFDVDLLDTFESDLSTLDDVVDYTGIDSDSGSDSGGDSGGDGGGGGGE